MGSVCLSHQENITSKCREKDVRKKGLVNALQATERSANEVMWPTNTQISSAVVVCCSCSLVVVGFCLFVCLFFNANDLHFWSSCF